MAARWIKYSFTLRENNTTHVVYRRDDEADSTFWDTQGQPFDATQWGTNIVVEDPCDPPEWANA
jgi:hypothetical protein